MVKWALVALLFIAYAFAMIAIVLNTKFLGLFGTVGILFPVFIAFVYILHGLIVTKNPT